MSNTLLHPGQVVNKTDLVLADFFTEREQPGSLSQLGSGYGFRPGNSKHSLDPSTMGCSDLST